MGPFSFFAQNPNFPRMGFNNPAGGIESPKPDPSICAIS